MTCGECMNVTAPGAGFPNHVYCKRFLLHMEKREDASKCRGFIPKPLTNADRIRSMTDEELAHLLHSAEEHLFTGNLWNYEKWTEWLKQEASE